MHGQCRNASYTRFSISSDIDLALGEDDPLGLSVQKAKDGQMPIDEVITLIGKLIVTEKARTDSYEKQIGTLETRVGELDTLIGKAQQTGKNRRHRKGCKAAR